MLPRMDAARALADLTEISSQIEQAAIVGADGAVLASTFSDDGRAGRFADGARRLMEEAEAVREARGLSDLGQLEAATRGGSVFVVRDAQRLIAATTRPEPTVGLVFYDLKHCLRSIEEPPPKKKTTRKPKAKPEPEANPEPEKAEQEEADASA
jgi:predicted regulator of Ras-like GTPase activity (Roadblock/LC7/MglB family)